MSQKIYAIDDIDLIIINQQQKIIENNQSSNNQIILPDSPKFIDLVGYRLIRFYKKIISSQDVGVCTFTPSCSEYAYIVFQHFPVFKALLTTGDRLMRCHGLNGQYYLKDKESGRNIDQLKY